MEDKEILEYKVTTYSKIINDSLPDECGYLMLMTKGTDIIYSHNFAQEGFMQLLEVLMEKAKEDEKQFGGQ